MMFKKIKSGIAPFDNLFQGLYLNRPTLFAGKRKSGTSTLTLRFLSHVLQIGEKLLLFTEGTPDHVSLETHGLGTDISEALQNEQLCIVPYDRQLPLLPFPEALDELRGLIVDRHYSFVVFDTVIPWLAAPADRLEERLNAFFGLLDETAATTLLVLRHPASPLAVRLFDEVSQRCAICINASRTVGGPHSLEVVKYMGAPPEKCPAVIQLIPDASDASPFLPPKPNGMNLQELHKATQRINVTIPAAYLSPTAHPPAPKVKIPASSGSGFTARPKVPAQPPHKPRAADRRPGEPAIAPLPLALPHTASVPHPAAPSPAPTPSPHQNPAATPHHAAPHHAIRFADAMPDATRPRETAPAAPFHANPTPPAPSPAAPEHPIRFSDIIQ